MWSTRPSRGVKPMRIRHFCQASSWPRSSKLGPSGWRISIGLSPARAPGRLGRVVGVLRRQRDDAAVLDLRAPSSRSGRRRRADWRPAARSRCPSAWRRTQVSARTSRRPSSLGEAEVARRPRIHHGQAEVGDPALAHGLLPARIGRAPPPRTPTNSSSTMAGWTPGTCSQDTTRPGSARRPPRRSCPCRAVHEHHESRALHRVARPVREHDLLRRARAAW